MYIYIYICYGSILLTLGLIGRDGGLSTLCHSYGFACQQRVLKTFPGPGYLHSKVQGWGSLTNIYIYIYMYVCMYIYILNTVINLQKKDTIKKHNKH